MILGHRVYAAGIPIFCALLSGESFRKFDLSLSLLPSLAGLGDILRTYM